MRPPDRVVRSAIGIAAAVVLLGSCTPRLGAEPAVPVLVSLLETAPDTLSRPYEAQIQPLGPVWQAGGQAQVSAVTFTSHSYQGKPVRIFGYYALPARSPGQRVPGLVLIHGGGGRAVLGRAVKGAANGFASLAIDLPGGGFRREESRSTGPDMTVWNLFRTQPALSENYLYHAVLAALRSVEYLRRQPEIDPDRVGMYGISWGGATTLIAASLDPRLAGAVDLFGSGYLPGMCTWNAHLEGLGPENVATWEANFDPAVYVPRMKPPILFVTGTNDGCYYLPRVLRTYEAVGSDARLLLRPNLDHRIDEEAEGMIWSWLRLVVRNQSPASDLPRFRAIRTEYEEGASRAAVHVAVGGTMEPVAGEVAYATDAGGWTKKQWSIATATRERAGWLTTRLPLAPGRTYAFVTVSCKDGVRVSSPVLTFVKADVNGECRPYYAPFLPDCKVDLPAKELAGDLGLDAEAVAERARGLLPPPDGLPPVQPRARLAEGRVYVAFDEIATLTGVAADWADGVPVFRTAGTQAVASAPSDSPKTSVPRTTLRPSVTLASVPVGLGAGGP